MHVVTTMYEHTTSTPETQAGMAIPMWPSHTFYLDRLEDSVILDTFYWVPKMSGDAVGLTFKICLVSNYFSPPPSLPRWSTPPSLFPWFLQESLSSTSPFMLQSARKRQESNYNFSQTTSLLHKTPFQTHHQAHRAKGRVFTGNQIHAPPPPFHPYLTYPLPVAHSTIPGPTSGMLFHNQGTFPSRGS